MTTLQELNSYARNTADFLYDQKVNSREGLEALIGTTYEKKNFKIEVKKREPNSIKLSYLVRDKGIPLEVMVSKKSDTAMIIIKVRKIVKGYSTSGSDHYGNTSQSRKIDFSSFEDVLNEIRFLAHYTGEVETIV